MYHAVKSGDIIRSRGTRTEQSVLPSENYKGLPGTVTPRIYKGKSHKSAIVYVATIYSASISSN